MSDDTFFEDEEPKSKKKNQNHDSLVIRNIMRTNDGRTYMWKKLQSFSVFETIFSNDPIKHAFDGGFREAGVQLNRELKDYAPAEYLKMIEENM